MMGKLNRQLMVSCSLAAGLLLASAPAVFAADPPSGSQAGGSATGQSSSATGQATATESSAAGQATAADNQANAADNQSPTGQSNSAAGQATAADNQTNAADNQANAHGNPGAASQGQGNPNPGGGNQGQGNPNPGGGNQGQGNPNPDGPPGNNGTIKIDGVDFDTHPNNEPHVGCTFQIDFYGFDKGDLYATVNFALQAPTTDGSLQVTSGSTRVFIGEDDNSGGGSVRGLDAEETYTLAFPDVTPHPKQGYHVKVTVNADGSQGADTKHKVFWVAPCAPTTTTGGTGGTGGTAVTGGSTAVTDQAVVGGTQQVQNQGSATTPATSNSRLAVLGEVIERSPATVAAVAAAPAAAGVNADNTARVLGTTLERGALARTGLNALQLLTMGALTILAGIAAVRVSRRKSEPGSPFVI